MAYRFRADGNIGRVAIYEATDDAPWSDPLSYKARVIFHSSLSYPARIATVTGTLSLPSRSGSGLPVAISAATHTLFAHGRPGVPLIEGRWIGIANGGADLPMIGSLPVQAGGTSDPVLTSAVNRWLVVGADATNVYAHEQWSRFFNGPTLGALSLGYEVHVLDEMLS